MLKWTFPFLILATSGHAALQTVSAKDRPSSTATPISPPFVEGSGPKSYMMIPPAGRALDFQQAFEQLKKEKSTGKVYFQLADGTTIANVIDMTLMPNSTLILFRFNSSQGIRFQVVKVEEILNLYY